MVALTVATASSIARPAAAAAVNLSGNWGIESSSSNLCLDDSTAHGLRLFPCNSASNVNGYQKFTLVINPYSGEANAYEIKNVKTGRCLDSSAAYGVRSFGCNRASYENGYQEWSPAELQQDGGGIDQTQWYNSATRNCLDFSAAYGLRGFGCNQASFDNGYQDWVLFKGSTPFG
jgi:hypothetical protein